MSKEVVFVLIISKEVILFCFVLFFYYEQGSGVCGVLFLFLFFSCHELGSESFLTSSSHKLLHTEFPYLLQCGTSM